MQAAPAGRTVAHRSTPRNVLASFLMSVQDDDRFDNWNQNLADVVAWNSQPGVKYFKASGQHARLA